ncbi:ATP-binding cassette domain-containing protein [Streptomyces sp. NPDC050636]|uniref:ATP-binding cassette domain-containing protein n=1 Tax=Streptomyces sp. NPDC050636 TaxID=3154510 RepID=UPI003424FE8D
MGRTPTVWPTGKSTLLLVILGLVRPDAGSVMVAGGDVVALRGRRLAEHHRKHMGMVFQFGELLPELYLVENVALAALLDGVDRDRAYDDSRKLLDELGVPVTDTATSELSGGERAPKSLRLPDLRRTPAAVLGAGAIGTFVHVVLVQPVTGGESGATLSWNLITAVLTATVLLAAAGTAADGSTAARRALTWRPRAD